MKKVILVISLLLAFALTATSFSAAEIIVGGTGETAKYTVEHYLESHLDPGKELGLTQSLDGYIGTNTEAQPEVFLGYSASKNYQQKIVTPNGSTKIAIDYSMDGFELGDVNCDGYIDLLDSVLLQRKLAGWEGYDHTNTCLYTMDSDCNGNVGPLDALMLLGTLAENDLANTEDNTVSITFKDACKTSIYETTPGKKLPENSDYTLGLTHYAFEGWYNYDYSKRYSVVPNTDTVLYAKYENITTFDFSDTTLYDPNNVKRFSIVENPFGSGHVAKTEVTSSVGVGGTLKGLTPALYKGNTVSSYKIEKGKTYVVSFKYRFANTDSSYSSCKFEVYASAANGLGVSGNKTALSLATLNGSRNLSLTNNWTEVTVQFTNTTDYTYPFFRFHGTNTTQNTLYIDDIIIAEQNNSKVKLTANGKTTTTDLKVGDTLPVLEPSHDNFTEFEHKFIGWYSSDSKTSYTTVASGITSYYAVFEDYSKYTFESAGMYDPNSRYSPTSGNLACWYRQADPVNSKNICLRANLSNNSNNANVALQASEGLNQGFKLKNNLSYIITFDYYISTTDSNFDHVSFSVRGSGDDYIGISGGKTDSLTGTDLYTTNQWDRATLCMKLSDEISDYDNLILLTQASTTDNKNCNNLKVYIDNIEITSLGNETVRIATTVKNITFNENGNKSVAHVSYIGAELPAPQSYYGAEFIGWYDDRLMTPYNQIPAGDIELKAKYNANIYNFTDGGYFDPNGNLGSSLSNFQICQNPDISDGNVIKIDFNGNTNNHNFCLSASGYDNTDGYKMTVGNKYTISFSYYIENVTSSGVNLQFRGSKKDSIGTVGGKSNACYSLTATNEGVWTNITATFTYSGSGLTDENNPYLIMLVQDNSSEAKATVYIDNIVVKETVPQKTYTKKSVKLGGWTVGYSGRYHRIVVPTYNFSYIAMLQCEELQKTVKGITTSSANAVIVHEDEWTEISNSINVFVGDFNGSSRDSSYKVDKSKLSADDYQINIGSGNVYINGGSPYALAMGVSEFSKMLETCEDGTSYYTGQTFSGKYSEKQAEYSNKTYYKPSFIEDFNGTEVNTEYWNVMDIGQYSAECVTPGKSSVRSAKHTVVEDGKLVISAAFDDDFYYGGMLRSHGKLQYKYGYLEASCIIPNGAGIWTAIWLTDNETDGLYRSEIDVNESFGDATKAAFNMHRWPNSAGKLWGSKKTSLDNDGYGTAKCAVADSGKSFNDEFHTFGFYWDENGAKYIVDGDIIFEYSTKGLNKPARKDADVDSFNEYLSLIISMTVGNAGHSEQFKLDESADYWNISNKYEVDYIHIYQIEGQDIIFTESQQ